MHGLYLLWWVQEKDMSPVLVATILAAGDVALMVIELPTGWFADRFGHRASLRLGSAVQVAGMLWCWLGEGVFGLITASVLVALGDGFRSGADQALLYRTCLALGREHDFQRIEARTEAIALATLVGLVLAGGVIVQQGGFAVGWLAETLLCAAGFACALGMVEPPAQAVEPTQDQAWPGEQSLQYSRLALTILPAALIGGAASASSFLAQTAEANTVIQVTLLVAALTAAEAAGCALAAHFPDTASRRTTMHLRTRHLMASATLFAMVALAVPSLLPWAALALAFLEGIAQPLRAASIQRLAADTIRARAASAASACDMAVNILLLPLAGAWRTRRRR